MKKLLTLVMVLCLMTTLSFSAVGETEFPELSGENKLTFWHSITNTTIYAAFEEVVNTFNAGIGAEKGIQIELVQYSSAAELNTAVTAAIMSGSAPDIIMGNSIYMMDYVNAEALVDMNPYIEHETYGIDMDDFYSCWLLNSNNYDDEHSMYCLPFQAYSEVVYYNVNFFNEHNLSIPTNWTEMEALARQIKEITGTAGIGWDNAAKMFTTLVEQAGIGYTDAKGNVLFAGENFDKTVETVQWYVDLVREGVFRTPGDSYYFSGPFANQNIMMYIGSGVEGAYIDMKIDPANPFEWSTFCLPQMENGKPSVFSENSLISIVDQGEDYEKRLAAWEFIKYFESTESMYKLTSVGAYLPVLKSVAQDSTWLENASPSQKTGAEQMEDYYAFYAFDTGDYNSSALYSDCKTAMENVLDNGADLRTELSNVTSMYGY